MVKHFSAAQFFRLIVTKELSFCVLFLLCSAGGSLQCWWAIRESWHQTDCSHPHRDNCSQYSGTPVLRSGAASARDKIWLKITQFLVETVAIVNSPLNLTNITQPVKKLSNKQIYNLPLYKHYNSFITSKLCYFYILPCLTCRNALPSYKWYHAVMFVHKW